MGMIPNGKHGKLRKNDPAFNGGSNAPWKKDSEKEGKYRAPANTRKKSPLIKKNVTLATRLGEINNFYSLTTTHGADEYSDKELQRIWARLNKDQETKYECCERLIACKKFSESEMKKEKKNLMQIRTQNLISLTKMAEKEYAEELERQEFGDLLADI